VELKRIADDYTLGRLLAEDLPAIAVRALEEGYDSPTLRQLAGAEGRDSGDLRTLFLKALQELGVQPLSPAEAGLSLARSIADDVLAGSIDPYDGARRIWSEVYTRFPHLVQLRPFVGLASEYEDDAKHREEYRRSIVEECRALRGG
jgi:hypothetical protein